MCGIVGIIAYRGSVPLEGLKRANNALKHRGPDDGGIQLIRVPADPPYEVALANRRLAILDLSPGGHQPMLDPETGDWIAYNGEVYNFRALRAQLENEGIQFSSQSDTEVVLKAYGKWGTEFLHELRGMFALAIWDAARQRLFLARDRLGIKPLYYSRSGDNFLFSSEVR